MSLCYVVSPCPFKFSFILGVKQEEAFEKISVIESQKFETAPDKGNSSDL